ncbi:MAG: hypothetical protein IPH72_30835 [Sandaracinaceae bacterium]|nr:hypothetical protein [Sandaracinaceae bacterium]
MWLLDQRRLPTEVVYVTLRKPDDWPAHPRHGGARRAGHRHRGGLRQWAQQAHLETGDTRAFMLAWARREVLHATRPTAVNLAWLIARMARREPDVAQAPPRSAVGHAGRGRGYPPRRRAGLL